MYCAFILFYLVAVPQLLSFDGKDFVSAHHDPAKPDQPALVLRVPISERLRSGWNPSVQLPVTAEEAIAKVKATELVTATPGKWKVLEVVFWAKHPGLYSDLRIHSLHSDDDVLISHYRVVLQRLPDGRSYPFMVLMDGSVYSPNEEAAPNEETDDE